MRSFAMKPPPCACSVCCHRCVWDARAVSPADRYECTHAHESPKHWGARRGGDNTRRKTTRLSSACQRPQNRSPRALGRKVQPPHDQGSSGFEFDSSECPAWVARFRPTLRRRESSALGRKVSSGEVPRANERWARPRLRRVPANGRLPSGNVPPNLRRRHPPCTLTRSPPSARPPRGASVCNGTGSNYGAAIYPYRYRYR